MSTSLPATAASGGTASLPATTTSSRSVTGATPSIASVAATAATTTPGVAGITAGITATTTAGFSPGTGISTTHVVILLRRELEVLELFTLGHVLLKKLRDILLGLKQSANQDRSQRLIALRVERGCQAAVTNATSTTYILSGMKHESLESEDLPMRWVYSSIPP